MIKSRRNKLSESLKNRRTMKNEKFKPTDNLSPSEVAAVVSDWTRRSFTDSWKTELNDGEEFSGEIKDTLAPMQIWINKKEKYIQIYYLSLDKADIDELVQIGLDSSLSADEAFIEEVCTAMRESFDNDHAMNYKEMSMPVTQIELEEALDECESKAIASYNRLESAFYNAVEGLRENKRVKTRKSFKEDGSRHFLDWEHPVLKDVMSTFKDDIQSTLANTLYSLKVNLPRLESDDESEVLRALASILDNAEDLNKVKKAMKRTSLGYRMW